MLLHTAEQSSQVNRANMSRKRVRTLTTVTIISFTISAVILCTMFLSYITDGSGLGPRSAQLSCDGKNYEYQQFDG